MAFISLTSGALSLRAPQRQHSVSFRSAALGRPLCPRLSSNRRTAALPTFIFAQQTTPETPDSEESSTLTPPTTTTPAEQVESASAVAATPPAAPAAEATEAAQAETTATDSDDETPDDEMDAPASGDRRRRRRRGGPNRRGGKRGSEVTMKLEDLKVGMELDGFVRGVTDYGAFIGGTGAPTDGLLHVSQLAMGYVENVSDVCKAGDNVKVRVLSVDLEKGTFSLTMKTAEQMEQAESGSGSSGGAGGGGGENARMSKKRRWDAFTYDSDEFVDGKVISITDFGAFCQLVDAEGNPSESAPTDGLIHISELSLQRVEKVSDVLSVGQAVKVRVIATDAGRDRLSLSLKPVLTEEEKKENAAANRAANQKKRAAESDDESSAVASDIAAAEANQPTFKTSLEIAFEQANLAASKKE